MAPTTRARVPGHTSAYINKQIWNQTKASIQYYQSRPEGIRRRLKELDKEWDIERALELNSSLVSLFGLVLGFTRNRRWFALPLAVQAFFMQHAVQGWCPPLTLLRKLGFRTADEINYERFSLKAIEEEHELHGHSETSAKKSEGDDDAVH